MAQQNKSSSYSQTSQDVEVYLRNNLKQAKTIFLPPQLLNHQLIHTVSRSLQTRPEKIMLFLRGQQITESAANLFIQSKNIIHVVHFDNVYLLDLSLRVKIMGEINKQATQYQVKSQSLIKDFIQNQLRRDTGEIFLVALGKSLDPFKTFQQEYIQNQSELICTNYKTPIGEKPFFCSHPIHRNANTPDVPFSDTPHHDQIEMNKTKVKSVKNSMALCAEDKGEEVQSPYTNNQGYDKKPSSGNVAAPGGGESQSAQIIEVKNNPKEIGGSITEITPYPDFEGQSPQDNEQVSKKAAPVELVITPLKKEEQKQQG